MFTSHDEPIRLCQQKQWKLGGPFKKKEKAWPQLQKQEAIHLRPQGEQDAELLIAKSKPAHKNSRKMDSVQKPRQGLLKCATSKVFR